MGDEDSNAIVSSKGCVEMWGGTNFLGPAMAMERWERSGKRRAERQPTMCTQWLPTSNLHCYLSVLFFLKFLGGRCCCRSCSCSRASIWMWRLDMDTQQQLSCKKGGGAHGNIQTKRFIHHKKDSSVFGLPCTLCISHLSYSLIIHELLSHLISLSPVLGGTENLDRYFLLE